MQDTKQISVSGEKEYCVYYHVNNGKVFYVGAGNMQRPFNLSGRTRKWRDYVNGLEKGVFQVEIKIGRKFPDREAALIFEKSEIKRLQPETNVRDKEMRKLYPVSFLLRLTREQEKILIRKAHKDKVSQAEVLRRYLETV